MKKITFLAILALLLSCAPGLYADDVSDEITIAVTVQQTSGTWGIAIKDNDSDNAINVDALNTVGANMHSMGNKKLVLGKVYLDLDVFDIYEVVVYSDAMNDDDNDATPYPLPDNWTTMNNTQKEDYVSKFAGLQNQNSLYKGKGLLYGASLKVRSEGIHGFAVMDNGGKVSYDSDDDGLPPFDSVDLGVKGTAIPVMLWDGKHYPSQCVFSPVPELANETLLGNDPILVAGSIKGSPLLKNDGTKNRLEVIFGASEEGIGSGTYATKVYFDLRWN